MILGNILAHIGTGNIWTWESWTGEHSDGEGGKYGRANFGLAETYGELWGFSFFLTYFDYNITHIFQSGRANYAYDDIGVSLLDLKMFHRACFYVKLGGRILFCSLMTGKYGRSWTNYK